LAQAIIQLRADSNDWVLVTHPQKESLPSELFAALPSQKVSQEVHPIISLLTQIAHKTFIPTEYAESLATKLKRGARAVPSFNISSNCRFLESRNR
jgi:hypothetical protein